MATTATQVVLDSPAAEFGFRPPTARLTHWTTLPAKKARSSSSFYAFPMLKR